MTQQEIEKLQAKIAEEIQQASVTVWCNAHGINPTIVTYKDGKIIIPVSF